MRITGSGSLVDKPLAKLLGSQPPEVAAEVARKWAEDQQKFFDAVKNAQGAKKQEEYAKPGCKRCYGRGYTGTNCSTSELVTCRCAIKSYHNWLQEFRLEFNKSREDYAADKPKASSGDGSTENKETLSDSTAEG